jgi:hypothetical protein
MSTEVVVALISAGVAVCSAAVSAYATARSIRLQDALTLMRSEFDRQEASRDLVRGAACSSRTWATSVGPGH